MADLWADLEDDVADIIQGDGDTVTLTTDSGAVSILVFWQSDSIEDEGLGPRCEVATADLPSDTAPGDTLVRNAVTYTVARQLPDGHGLTVLLLGG